MVCIMVKARLVYGKSKTRVWSKEDLCMVKAIVGHGESKTRVWSNWDLRMVYAVKASLMYNQSES